MHLSNTLAKTGNTPTSLDTAQSGVAEQSTVGLGYGLSDEPFQGSSVARAPRLVIRGVRVAQVGELAE
jgi:hypothetical protein